jgi:hypothetical protein
MVSILDARPAPILPDLIPRLPEQILIGDVVPLHQLLDQPEQTLALDLLDLLCREVLWM